MFTNSLSRERERAVRGGQTFIHPSRTEGGQALSSCLPGSPILTRGGLRRNSSDLLDWRAD